MNVHGHDLNLQTKKTGGRFCLTTRSTYTELLNVTFPWKFKMDNVVGGGGQRGYALSKD